MSKYVTPIAFDPLSTEVLKDPAKMYGAARNAGHILKVSGRFEQGFYIVTRYDDVKNVMTDHDNWTKREGSLLRSTEKNIALSQDPPSFNKFRRIYASFISPKNVQRWAAAMQDYVEEYIDAILPIGHCDLHDDFARPLPVKVMATVLGLPMNRLDDYRKWTDFFLLSAFNEPDPKIGTQAIQELYGFFNEQFFAREQALTKANIPLDHVKSHHIGTVLSDDLLSLLLVARIDGRPLTLDEKQRTARGFFVGNDTFTSLILNVLYRLLENKTLWQTVQADRTLVPVAIEESLRFDAPTIGMFRLSARPVEINNVLIPKNSRVLFAIPGANHDPNVFESPDEYRLDRPKSELQRHLAFGFGTHFCPGASIARLEAEIALNYILDTMPNLALTEEPVRIDPFNFWGYKTFKVKW